MTDTARPRILVTGASGMLGSHVVDRLADAGCGVVATDLEPPVHGYGWEAEGVDFHQGDITTSDLAALVDDVDSVVHVAAMLQAADFDRERVLFDVNVVAAHRLFAAAARQGKKVVFASSGGVYGASRPVDDGRPGAPFRESDLGRDLDFYALSKRTDELYAEAFGRRFDMPWNALRCGVLYGPRLRMGVSTRFLLSVLDDLDAGRTPVVDGDPDAGLDWIGVEAAAECFAAAVLGDITDGPLNIATGVALRLEDVLTTLVTVAGSDTEIRWAGKTPTGGFSGTRYYDPSLARTVLGVPLESELTAGLERFVAWRRAVREKE